MDLQEMELRKRFPKASEAFIKRNLQSLQNSSPKDKSASTVAWPAAPSDSSPKQERDLHEQIIEELGPTRYLFFHGSMAHRTYRTEGEPDFVIFGYFPNAWLVEAKTKTGKLSPEQLSVAAQAQHLGWTVHVVRSIEDFRATIQTQPVDCRTA